MMEDKIGGQWHLFLINLCSNLLEFEELPAGVVGAELRKIEMPSCILNVIIQPEPDRLDLCIPRIACAITVAIITGHPECFMDIRRYRQVPGENAGGGRTGRIFRRPHKLHKHRKNAQNKNNTFDDLHQDVGRLKERIACHQLRPEPELMRNAYFTRTIFLVATNEPAWRR
jgi:hypothetical protein